MNFSQALVPLTIVLREATKAQREAKKNYVNVTSTFLMDRLPCSSGHPDGISMCSGPMIVSIDQVEHTKSDPVDKVRVVYEQASRDDCS